ncbi:hypothetical protein CBOM_03909 [Ceraceosorus bombacis]|uniref:Uncharacterized protein n=1 Tax=Ceraceosorus bombacis TaxID=401625 RepID=A0A0P1BLG7_9BASI|nr:hypothetical protein CBOM_03909 [Ceraceosorus bombacis]
MPIIVLQPPPPGPHVRDRPKTRRRSATASGAEIKTAASLDTLTPTLQSLHEAGPLDQQESLEGVEEALAALEEGAKLLTGDCDSSRILQRPRSGTIAGLVEPSSRRFSTQAEDFPSSPCTYSDPLNSSQHSRAESFSSDLSVPSSMSSATTLPRLAAAEDQSEHILIDAPDGGQLTPTAAGYFTKEQEEKIDELKELADEQTRGLVRLAAVDEDLFYVYAALLEERDRLASYLL